MAKYNSIERTIEVPPETGREGILRALGAILDKPRVQDLHLGTQQGMPKITYRRMVRDNEPEEDFEPLELELKSLSPFHVLRRVDMEELELQTTNAAAVLGNMFHAVATEGLWPIAFVIGSSSRLNDWYHRSTKIALPRAADSLHGTPLLTDQQVDDEILVLLAGYTRSSAVVDALRAFKVYIPGIVELSERPYVEVMP